MNVLYPVYSGVQVRIGVRPGSVPGPSASMQIPAGLPMNVLTRIIAHVCNGHLADGTALTCPGGRTERPPEYYTDVAATLLSSITQALPIGHTQVLLGSSPEEWSH